MLLVIVFKISTKYTINPLKLHKMEIILVESRFMDCVFVLKDIIFDSLL